MSILNTATNESMHISRCDMTILELKDMLKKHWKAEIILFYIGDAIIEAKDDAKQLHSFPDAGSSPLKCLPINYTCEDSGHVRQ